MTSDTKKKAEKGKVYSFVDDSKKQTRYFKRDFVIEYGTLESLRSERYGIPFSLALIEATNAGVGLESEIQKMLVDKTLEVMRECDLVTELNGQRIAVFQPHTDYFGSIIAVKKLAHAIEDLTREHGEIPSVTISQGTYPKDANSFEELMDVASRRMNAKRESLWEQLGLKSKSFWEAVAIITSAERDTEYHSCFEYGPNEDGGDTVLDQINKVVLTEISRTPKKRGYAYLGLKTITSDLHIKDTLTGFDKCATRIYLVGDVKKDAKVISDSSTTISISDQRLSDTFFTLFLNEDMAYAIICKEEWGDSHSCFHTSDTYLVEGLISKFQKDYSLQDHL